MTFLHAGLAAAGLACIAIPILIHLLMRRRRKPVMWGAMRFLLEAYRRQRRRLMIEKWLLLALRCLLVGLVGLAVGRPLLGALGAAGGGRTVYLLIDNGLASQAVGADGRTALDRHKEAARAVLGAIGGLGGAAGEGDRVGLVATGGPAEGLVIPPSSDLGAVRGLVDGLKATDSATDIPGALRLVAKGAGTGRGAGGGSKAGPERGLVVVLTDYREGSADLGASLAALPAGLKVVSAEPAASGAGNVSITGVEPMRSVVVTRGASAGANAGDGTAGSADQVRVMLRRSGESVGRAGQTRVKVRLGAEAADAAGTGPGAVVRWSAGQDTAVGAVQISGGAGGSGSAAAMVEAGEGTEVMEARIETVAGPSGSDDVVAGDDVRRRPVEVRRSLRVGLVAPRRFGARDRVDRLSAAEWLRLALRPADAGGGVEVVEIEPGALDGARLSGLDAVVLARPDMVGEESWRRLRVFLEGGGLVLVSPPSGVTVHLWPDVMVREFGLGWTLGREVKEYARPAADSGAGAGGGARLAPGAPEGGEGEDLLSQVRGEMDGLVRPVSVWKVLPMLGESGAPGGRRLLALTDGTTVVWAGRGGEKQQGSKAVKQQIGKTGDGQSDAVAGQPRGAQAEKAADEAAASGGGGGRGLVVYVAMAMELDWTDLPAKPLMVPLMQEIVLQGVGRAHGTWWSVAGARPPAPARSAELVRVKGPRDRGNEGSGEGVQDRVAVDETGSAAEPMRRAGVWKAVDERGAVRGLVAVNADPRAGRMGVQERRVVEAWLAKAAPDGQVVWLSGAGGTGEGTASGSIERSVAAMLARGDKGNPISLPLLMAALACAVIEMWVARWSSHAGIGVGRGAAVGERIGAPAREGAA